MKLTEKEVFDHLRNLNGWALDKGQIHKDFIFKDFMEAIKFVNRGVPLVETMDHHPDIDIRYNKVSLSLMTHSAGGLTEKDFKLAAALDAL